MDITQRFVRYRVEIAPDIQAIAVLEEFGTLYQCPILLQGLPHLVYEVQIALFSL